MDTYIPSFNKDQKSTASWLNPSPASGMESKVAGFQLPNLESITANQRLNRTNMMNSQDTTMGNWLSGYNKAISGQENVGAMYNRLGEELGIPQLRQNALGLQSQLTSLPQVMGDASKNFNVNANQLARMVSTKTAALAPLATNTMNAYQSATGALANQMPWYLQQQQKELAPYEKEFSYINDRNARETTGFNTDNQNELDSLIAKMNAGVTLNEGEKNRANELALQEMRYKQAMDTQKLANEGSLATAKLNAGTWG